MGVRGLTTYINCNQDAFLHRHYLHNSNLVIDGHSLCAQLYRLLNSFSAFGGDYDKFASYTKMFFKNLLKCKITPYVLFDGSYEVRKLKTAFSRLRSKINGASHLDPVTQSSLQIFPLLLRDVFKEVLQEMNIPYTVCEFEADEEIAAMARHLNCPVLSYDSDFFIYNVLYIPFNTIEIKPKQILVNDDKLHVIECKIYKVEYLVKYFGGIKEELLPLLATLLGNDFVEKRVFKKFFSQLKLHKSRKKKNEQQKSIHALFKWLQNETLDSAIAKILGRLKMKERNKVFAIITKSINGYNTTHCQSLKYFNISDDSSIVNLAIEMPVDVNEDYSDNEQDNVNEESNNESDSCSSSDTGSDSDEMNSDNIEILPKWFAEAIRGNQMPHSYLNLFTHHLHFCSPQAEDYSDQDSFLCVLPIIRYAFDMLTDFSHESFVYVSREKDCEYRKMLVGKEYSTSKLLETTYSELSSEELKKCFHHFLDQKLPNIDFNTIELLPSNFQLFMISVFWWVANCSVPLSHVHSLIMSYVYLGAIDEKTGSFRGHYFFNNKYSKKLQDLKTRPIESTSIDELFLNKHKLQYEDCLVAAGVLLKHFEIDDSIRKRPKSYDIKKVHSFAQFQCCLQQFNSLNVMCGRPFVETVYSKCYNGTFVYNIALKLENQEPMNFIEQYLKGATSVLKFYKSLSDIFNKCLSNMNISTVIWSNRKKRSRRKKNANGDEEIMFIIKGFESDVVI